VIASAACRLAVALLLSVSLVAAPPPQSRPASVSSEPNVLALVLEVSENSVRLVSAVPSRGRVVEPDVEARVGALRSGDVRWFDYSVKADSSAAPVRGGFLVSMRPLIEAPGGKAAAEKGADSPIRVSRRIVVVAVPLSRDSASISFTRVQPSPTLPPKQWTRVPAGAAALPAVQR
jgi:hypothetical protein